MKWKTIKESKYHLNQNSKRGPILHGIPSNQMTRVVGLLSLLILVAIPIRAESKDSIDHAPAGVTADHYHKKGESMISLSYSFMKMQGNLLNGKHLNDEEIIQMSNPLSSAPPKLSIVPIRMLMPMVMFGGMHSISDRVTLMAMSMFTSKDMSLNTYSSMMNRPHLGSFKVKNNEFSNISFSSLVKIHETESNRWHIELGLDKSIASKKARGTILTPMNTEMNMILPYGMQGDGSLRWVSSLTNTKKFNLVLFGNQIRVKHTISSGQWNFGNTWEYTSWLQKSLNRNFSISARFHFLNQGQLEGRNTLINGPVPTANPINYGGRVFNLGLGLNTIISMPAFGDIRLGAEVLSPLGEDKNNLQMQDLFRAQIKFQKSF